MKLVSGSKETSYCFLGILSVKNRRSTELGFFFQSEIVLVLVSGWGIFFLFQRIRQFELEFLNLGGW